MLRYLKSTLYCPLILRADNLNVLKWWVDASFATHPDMKGHTGATMSMGRGSTISMSKKQKLNVRSSTEGEIVGVDDAAGQMMWSKYFLEAQGYSVEVILYQDNLSAMLLETNGRASSGQRTKHIRVRFYFIKDLIARGEVGVQHCPTGEMLADPFTKPLQGAAFRKFRAEIQGIPVEMTDVEMGWERPVEKRAPEQNPADEPRSAPSPQECVGGSRTSHFSDDVSEQAGLFKMSYDKLNSPITDKHDSMDRQKSIRWGRSSYLSALTGNLQRQ